MTLPASLEEQRITSKKIYFDMKAMYIAGTRSEIIEAGEKTFLPASAVEEREEKIRKAVEEIGNKFCLDTFDDHTRCKNKYEACDACQIINEILEALK